jgi:voltage-gated potassium channel
MNRDLRRAALVGAAMAGALVLGACGYVWLSGYSWFDAFYMAAITMTTVGYGEVRPLTEAGRVFNIFYLVLSASLLLLAMGVVTHTVVGMQVGNLLGKRRTRKMIEELKNHYIVCGFGRVGRGASAELAQAGATFVVLDRNPERTEWAAKLGYLTVTGDATRDEVLKEAGISRAAGLISTLATDADNLFAVISAKTLQPGIRVSTRAAEEEAERKMRHVGADSVFAPYTMTGMRLAQALLRPHVHQFLNFAMAGAEPEVRIEQVAVSESSDLAGKSLADTRMRSEMQVIVLAIRRASGEMLFNPPADAVVRGGDCLIVMGEPEPLRRLEARIAGGA